MFELSVEVYYIIAYSNFPPGYALDIVRDAQGSILQIRDEIEGKMFKTKYIAEEPKKPAYEVLLRTIDTIYSLSKDKYVVLIKLTSKGDGGSSSLFHVLYSVSQRGLKAIQKPDENVKCCCGITVGRTGNCYV